MSAFATLSLDQLPLDVLHCVFYHLDIPDILKIRRVCHTFRASNLAYDYLAGLSMLE